MKPESFRRLASRMSHIAPFEVMEIQTAARELERQGKDVIHMEIGEPDFTTPQPIVNAAIAALQTKPMFYTSALGIQPLREAIAAFYASKYGLSVSPERIIVTAGSSAALLLACGVLLNAGDEVLMADPGLSVQSPLCARHGRCALHDSGGAGAQLPVDGRAYPRALERTRRGSAGGIALQSDRHIDRP